MEHLQLYILTILLASLFLELEGQPICYSRKVLNEQNAVVKRVDCNANSNMIYKRFDSKEAVSTSELMEDVLDEDPAKYSPLPDKDVCLTECSPVTCLQSDLPIVVNGTFQCTGGNPGDKCKLTCNNGSYPAASEVIICQRNCSETGAWSDGYFECVGCTDWSTWTGNYYRLTHTDGDWNTTAEMCRSYSGCINGSLVTIQNKKENDHVQKLASLCSRSWTWIGLNGNEDDWKWKQHNEATYFNWEEDQPETMLNRGCAMMSYINGKWHNVSCNSIFYAVCEASMCT